MATLEASHPRPPPLLCSFTCNCLQVQQRRTAPAVQRRLPALPDDTGLCLGPGTDHAQKVGRQQPGCSNRQPSLWALAGRRVASAVPCRTAGSRPCIDAPRTCEVPGSAHPKYCAVLLLSHRRAAGDQFGYLGFGYTCATKTYAVTSAGYPADLDPTMTHMYATSGTLKPFSGCLSKGDKAGVVTSVGPACGGWVGCLLKWPQSAPALGSRSSAWQQYRPACSALHTHHAWLS